MLSATLQAGSGSQWFAGTAAATKMASDGLGTALATFTNADLASSFTYNRELVIVGLLLNAASAGTAEIGFAYDSGGGAGATPTQIALLYANTASVGFTQFSPEGCRVSTHSFTNFSVTNKVGALYLTLPAGATGSLIFKVLT